MPHRLHPRLKVQLATLVTLLALGACFTGASCSHDSYLVLTLSGDMAFNNVARIEVDVQDSAGIQQPTLTYITGWAVDAGFDMNTKKTLSIAFTPSRSGTVTFTVRALDPLRACLGVGTATHAINKGGVSEVPITILHSSSCSSVPDAGTMADSGVTFPGCDPGTPGACSGNQTCFVNCSTKKGECLAAGTRGPGETCTSNSDCVPGTQCFTYSCGTQICLKFCNGDSQCATTPGGSGGAGVEEVAEDGSGATAGNGGAGGRAGAPAAAAAAAVTGWPRQRGCSGDWRCRRKWRRREHERLAAGAERLQGPSRLQCHRHDHLQDLQFCVRSARRRNQRMSRGPVLFPLPRSERPGQSRLRLQGRVARRHQRRCVPVRGHLRARLHLQHDGQHPTLPKALRSERAH